LIIPSNLLLYGDYVSVLLIVFTLSMALSLADDNFSNCDLSSRIVGLEIVAALHMYETGILAGAELLHWNGVTNRFVLSKQTNNRSLQRSVLLLSLPPPELLNSFQTHVINQQYFGHALLPSTSNTTTVRS
jgi:hypothetical protein